MLEEEALPPTQPKLDPKVWNRGEYMKLWLDSDANTEEKETPFDSSDFETFPGTALVTGNWKDNNKLNAAKLSQFPLGGLEGLFEIVDPNLTIPSFDNSCSKEGVVISLILFSYLFLERRWETLFRGYNGQLKKRSIATLARQLNYLRESASTNLLANLVPPCHFKHNYLLPAEAYCHKAFEAYKGKHKAGASSQAEPKQTEVAREVLETGAVKNGRELV